MSTFAYVAQEASSVIREEPYANGVNFNTSGTAIVPPHHNAGFESSTALAQYVFDVNTSRIGMGRLADKIERLFRNAKYEEFEDGVESDFSRNLLSVIHSSGSIAIDVIHTLINNKKVSDAVVAEALRWIGWMGDGEYYIERRYLLENCLFAHSAQVRDGATIGLSYLGDPQAIEYLQQQAAKEPIVALRRDMEATIRELQAIR